MPTPCQSCHASSAKILRPKDHARLCAPCFIAVFEQEIHHTITSHRLFARGERIAIGASGGKDSTVLASVLSTLNARHDYGLDLHLLSIDEGITGYRDDSLETVKRNAVQYGLPLTIVGYDELYGWTMDRVVAQIGKKGNCTYCGVFRRQALDRGAERLGVSHVVTGHNADDVAETVLMNLLRGDIARLARGTAIVTATPATTTATKTTTAKTAGNDACNSSQSAPKKGCGTGCEQAPQAPARPPSKIKRSKPLKFAYEKEIVLYAHHKKLDYFSTECIYSPEAFRGSARALIKDLERIRPSAILDVVRSGEDMARLCPGYEGAGSGAGGEGGEDEGEEEEEEGETGCGSLGRSGGGEMGRVERELGSRENASVGVVSVAVPGRKPPEIVTKKQTAGVCERCGYMASQKVCKACALLEGLNRSRPKREVAIGNSDDEGSRQKRERDQTEDELSEGLRRLEVALN